MPSVNRLMPWVDQFMQLTNRVIDEFNNGAGVGVGTLRDAGFPYLKIKKV